jgi:hypothetical protein
VIRHEAGWPCSRLQLATCTSPRSQSCMQQEVVALSLQLLQMVERTIEQEALWGRLSVKDLRALTPYSTAISILMASFRSTWRGLCQIPN